MSHVTDRRSQPQVPVVDLRPQHDPIRAEIDRAIARVIDDHAFSGGPDVLEFEERFAAYCGSTRCVGVNTGTSALHLAMQGLGIGPGDEVVTVSMSFIATAWPILYLGATPVFVDIESDRYTMDPEKLESAITERTKAIVVVHLYGQCARMDRILEIADAWGVPVIEDCAQSHGAEHRGRRAGTMGRVGCFSFYPSKNLGAFGEAGALVTDDQELADWAARARDHAQDGRYHHAEVGYNYRMDGVQGAVLTVKLAHLEAWTEARREAAASLDAALEGAGVSTPAPCPDGRHVYHLYVVRRPDRDRFREVLSKRGIATAVHYPDPIHRQPPFSKFCVEESDLGQTVALARECVSLPLYPGITDVQIGRVAEAVRGATL